MNTTTAANKGLKVGDQVWFNYGCMHGTDIGTVVGVEKMSFGDQAWVRKSDFSLEAVELNVGEVLGVIELCDFEGEPYFIPRSTIPSIGAYRIVLSK